MKREINIGLIGSRFIGKYYSRNNNEDNGFRNILVTERVHPYIDNWRPPGHIIGWEHTFIHQFRDFFEAIAGSKTDIPDFQDGLICQQALDTIQDSAETNTWTEVQINQSFV